MPTENTRACDALVVGGGAAGRSCAIFTAQAGRRTALVDAGESAKETRQWHEPGDSHILLAGG